MTSLLVTKGGVFVILALLSESLLKPALTGQRRLCKSHFHVCNRFNCVFMCLILRPENYPSLTALFLIKHAPAIANILHLQACVWPLAFPEQ